MQTRDKPYEKGYLISVFGVVLILLWLGVFKFTPTEAAAIKPLVENHLLMGWLYSIFSVQAVSNLIGLTEIIVGILLLVGLKNHRFGFYAGIAASVIFIVTLSFILTTPGVFKVVDGLLVVEFFLLKDVVFLGVSINVIERNRAYLSAKATA